MSSKYLDMSPPVAGGPESGHAHRGHRDGRFHAASLPPEPHRHAGGRAGVLEPGLRTLFCGPLVDGRVKAGLTREEMDRLCQTGTACSRWTCRGW